MSGETPQGAEQREMVAGFIDAIVSMCTYPTLARARRMSPQRRLRAVMEWLCAWPPDLFAVTWALLHRTGTYRFSLCPPTDGDWPERPNWGDQVEKAVEHWHVGLGRPRRTPLHPLIEEALSIFVATAPIVVLEKLQHQKSWQATSREWKLIRATLVLHAYADAASSGFGLVFGTIPCRRHKEATKCDVSRAKARVRLLGNAFLSTNGTLSRIPKQVVCVLPKLRTPQRGLSIRTLTHHLCAYAGEVNAIWRTVPFLGLHANSINLMLVPHPCRFSVDRFQLARDGAPRGGRCKEGFFTYRSGESLPIARLVKAVERAEQSIGTVDIIMLPELSITEEELYALQRELLRAFPRRSRFPAILAGLRGTGPISAANSPTGTAPENELVFSFFFAGKWYESLQQKHHRWCLDESQIRQYGLAGRLPPKQLWWESFAVGRRNQSFLIAAPWLCIAPLICEDLAQQDPLADLVRSVGPQLVAALLMDGPQLPERWPGRYASVLADDPGSAVLTLTSAGIAGVSRPVGASGPSEGPVCVGLWKDPVRGWERVQHERGTTSTFHVLTASARFREEFTTDGRSDHGVTPVLEFDQVRLVTLPDTPKLDQWQWEAPTSNDARTITTHRTNHRKLDLEELTRLVFAIDHMLVEPNDAHLVAQLLGGPRNAGASVDLAALERWFPHQADAMQEIAGKTASRIGLRVGKGSSEGGQRAHKDLLYALGRGVRLATMHVPDADKEAQNGRCEWRPLLKMVQAEIQRLDTIDRENYEDEVDVVHDDAASTSDSDELNEPVRVSVVRARERFDLRPIEAARTEWLVATVLHYLVKLRLERAREESVANSDDLRLLHEIEELFDVGNLVGDALWRAVIGAFAPGSPGDSKSAPEDAE